MPNLKQIGRIIIPVADQDDAIKFYTETLGFTVTADMPFGDGDRWVEVTPPGGGAALALAPPQGEYKPGRMTGVSLQSSDPRADYEELKKNGVDVDGEILGGDGTVPLLFFFRDNNGNQLLIAEGE